MSKQYLKDRLGHTIGVIETKDGKQILRTPQGQRLGHYDERKNRTYQYPSDRLIGEGNLLAHLLPS